jgi:hypothetical protein
MMNENKGLKVGQRVTCRPSGLQGVVYALAPNVVYVQLEAGKCEIITSPYDMLDLMTNDNAATEGGAIVKG